MTPKEKISILQSQKKIKIEEIKLKQSEISVINRQLFELEWQEMTWDELERWLKENRTENDYEKNPVVSTRMGNTTYCFLTDKGELQIGSYYHNDNFPRGKNVLVSYDFKSYRDS